MYSVYRLPAVPSTSSTASPEKIAQGYNYVAGVEPNGRGLYVGKSTGRNQASLDFIPLSPAPGSPVHIADMNFSDDCWVSREGLYYFARLGDRPLAPVSLRFRTHSGDVDRLLQNYSKPPGRGISISGDRRFAITMRIVPPISDLLLLDTSCAR